jgi:hypothetical protein
LVAVAVAVLLTASPLLAGAGSHRACARMHESACRTVRLKDCCHCGNGSGTTQPAVTQSRFDITTDQSAVSLLPPAIQAPLSVIIGGWHADTSPPPAHPPRLPILLSDLRI